MPKRVANNKQSKSFLCIVNYQNRTFVSDSSLESIECSDNKPKKEDIPTIYFKEDLIRGINTKQNTDKLTNVQVHSLIQIEQFGSY